jgi:hypothetical protein
VRRLLTLGCDQFVSSHIRYGWQQGRRTSNKNKQSPDYGNISFAAFTSRSLTSARIPSDANRRTCCRAACHESNVDCRTARTRYLPGTVTITPDTFAVRRSTAIAAGLMSLGSGSAHAAIGARLPIGAG